LVNSIIHILANKLYKVNCKTVRLAKSKGNFIEKNVVTTGYHLYKHDTMIPMNYYDLTGYFNHIK